MARQQIVESICDRCHTHEEQPLTSGIKNGEYVLPKGWMHVQGTVNGRTIFEVDLCDVCKATVMDAAGKGKSKDSTRILREVSNS